MRVLTPRPAFAKRDGSPWMWTSLGWASEAADCPLADRFAPAAKAASAAPCFRNRLRPDRLESMISSRDPYKCSAKSSACQPAFARRGLGKVRGEEEALCRARNAFHFPK